MNKLTCLLALAFLTLRAEPVALIQKDSLAGWNTAKGEPAAVGQGWEVADGVLHRAKAAGDLISAAEYGDFTLTWEWKLSPGVNGGLKYKVAQYNGSWLGAEYQMLDDPKHMTVPAKERTASFYAVKAPAEDKPLRPAGEWNQSKVVVAGTKFTHWLNGAKVLEIDTATPEFEQAVAASKFKKTAGFARNEKGRLLIQDHGGEVWIRNLAIDAK